MIGSAILGTLILALLLIVAPAIFIPSAGTAEANGGTRPVVTNAIVGPYKVQVGIFPGQPRVGNLHLSIRVEDASGEQVLTGATVFTSLTGPPGATRLRSHRTNLRVLCVFRSLESEILESSVSKKLRI